MELFDNLGLGLETALRWENLLYCFLGVVLGTAVGVLPGIEEVETELTWDPPWSPEKMSDDAKFILGFG